MKKFASFSISERLLQFIWQFQYFNTRQLLTAQGEEIKIVHPGFLNHNQGPDFTEAKIKRNNILWVGNVELHLKASDWLLHKHQTDSRYQNIILHVVWENDREITDSFHNLLPTIELQPIVSQIMLKQYEHLMQHTGFVPCENSLPALSTLQWTSWKERLAVERLQQKTSDIFERLQATNNHWEEVFWQLLAKNFGAKANSISFENIAHSISVTLLAKHKQNLLQIEALWLGQAGLLNASFHESYPLTLQKEYSFLSKKYTLMPAHNMPLFSRMRPANFPTIRLAQLAQLIHHSSHLFSIIKELSNVEEIKKLFTLTASEYWNHHYKLEGAYTSFQPKKLGSQMVQNILINTVVPIVFAYGLYTQQEAYKNKALDWLQAIEKEKNAILKNWEAKQVTNNNALDSQALLQLKTKYCTQKRCLDCAVGNFLFQTNHSS